jgi:hypothetical protein
MLESETCVSSQKRGDTRLMIASERVLGFTDNQNKKCCRPELDGHEAHKVIWVMGPIVETRTKPRFLGDPMTGQAFCVTCSSRPSIRCNDALIPCIPLVIDHPEFSLWNLLLLQSENHSSIIVHTPRERQSTE